MASQRPLQIIDRHDRRLTDFDDQVARLDPHMGRGRIRLHLHDTHGCWGGECIIQDLPPPYLNGLAGDAEIRPAHASFADELTGHPLGRVRGKGKTDPLRSHDHRRAYTYYLTAEI